MNKFHEQKDLIVRLTLFVDSSGHLIKLMKNVVIEWILVVWIELCLNAQNKTWRKWSVNNLVVSLAIWCSSAALLFVNFKFYVPTNDDCTVELHYPFTVWKGISEVLKQFSGKLFFFFHIYIYRHQILLFVLVSLFYFRKDRYAAWKANLWYIMNTLCIF